MRNKESKSMVTQPWSEHVQEKLLLQPPQTIYVQKGMDTDIVPPPNSIVGSRKKKSLAMSLERGESCTCVMDWT